MRSKEEAHDYRYFPEPDIPPVIVSEEMLNEIKAELPELPHVRRERFLADYKLPEFDAEVLTDTRYMADFFENILDKINKPKSVSNLIITEVRRVLNERSIDIKEFPISTERLAGLIQLREDDKISSSAMQTIFNAMLDGDKNAEDYARELNLLQVSDTGFIDSLVDDVLNQNPEKVKEYLGGKEGLLGFFIGQVMRNSKGKANPQVVRDTVLAKIQGHE